MKHWNWKRGHPFSSLFLSSSPSSSSPLLLPFSSSLVAHSKRFSILFSLLSSPSSFTFSLFLLFNPFSFLSYSRPFSFFLLSLSLPLYTHSLPFLSSPLSTTALPSPLLILSTITSVFLPLYLYLYSLSIPLLLTRNSHPLSSSIPFNFPLLPFQTPFSHSAHPPSPLPLVPLSPFRSPEKHLLLARAAVKSVWWICPSVHVMQKNNCSMGRGGSQNN